MYKLLVFSALLALSAAAPRVRRGALLAPAAVPAVAAVPALAAVPTLTAVHSQRLIPQPPAVHTVARPTTVLQTVQTGNAITGHQHVGDQVVGKTADVNGYAFKSDVRHDAPIPAPAPVAIAAAPLLAPAPLPVAAPAPVAVAAPAPVAAAAPALPIVSAVPAPAPVQTIHPAPPAQVKSYTVETGHQVAHDHVVTSPVIKSTVHSPVIGSQPIIGQVPVAAPAVVAAPAPLALPAPALVPAPYKS